MDLNKQAQRTILICVVLAGAALAAFWAVTRCDFINFDDPTYVSQNPQVLAGIHWKTFDWGLRSGYGGNWHPVTWWSHMLDAQVYGLRASGHHLTSLLFHIGNSLLLFGLFRRLSGAIWSSAFVAALFALHPLHVESVAWVSERKDVLSTFFFLLTLWAYTRFAERQVAKGNGQSSQPAAVIHTPLAARQGSAAGTESSPNYVSQPGHQGFHFPSSILYLLALLVFAFGLMSKPMLVTVPFVMLLLDFWPLQRLQSLGGGALSSELADRPRESSTHWPPGTARKSRIVGRILIEKLPFLALSVVSCIVTFQVQRSTGATASLEVLPLEFRICNALISYVRYVCKMMWPADLAIFYPVPAEWPEEWVVGAALVLVVVSGLALRSVRRAPWFAFGWFWYLGTLVPVIGIVQVGRQAMADRYSYIPLIGLFVVIAWGAAAAGSRWPKSRAWLSAGGAAALLACGGLTWHQTGFWHDSVSLFEHALAVTRDNFLAHNNLAVALWDKGDLSGAESELRTAVRVKGNYADALGNLGFCCQQQGRLTDAQDYFEQSLKARPTASVHYRLANLLLQQGKLEEAQAHYEAALRLKPELTEAWYNLGALEAKQGRAADAERDYRMALRVNPAHVQSNITLGALLAGNRRFDEAITHFRTALHIAPDNANAHYNLAAALNAQGDYAGAAVEFAEACRLQPQDIEARMSLGLALLCQGKDAEAAGQFREVVKSNAGAPGHYYLALALDKQGLAEQALAQYREAVRLSPGTPVYLNDLAWFLATNPKAELRDGAGAVRLAERACQLSGGKEASFWGTLDAAYAEVGRFTDAQATAAKARELALASGNRPLADAAAARSQLYQQGRPYRTP